MIIDIFQLDKSISFAQIKPLLLQKFGFVFLQDQNQPFFAIYPKYLQIVDQGKSFYRQADFHYVEQTQTPLLEMNFCNNQINTADLSFRGGYIAFISYDYAAQQQIEQRHSIQQPAAIIGEYDIFIKLIDQQWRLFAEQNLMDHPVIQNLIQQLQHCQEIKTPIPFTLKNNMQPRWSKTKYRQAFQRVQDYLHAGDCYQINLTQEFSTQVASGNLSCLLPELLQLSQAPFAGYIQFEDFELLSCSPELFIEFQPNRILKTRPIKGTLPRHQDPKQDQQLKQQLANSEKDQAENLMIVDLLRNDLSVYAQTGTVKVPTLFEIESFAQVHHMVSEIQAKLKDDVNVLEVLLSALPGGSITGAPKIRAMQIIDELEGNARGAYCGSLGYFNNDGTGRFNILIRTIQRYGDQLSVWAGGGITVASDADAEYQECLDKVSALLDFLNQYSE